MPVGSMGGCKSPDEAVAGQPSLDMRIPGNILYVVVMDKVMILHLPKD
jgi:hypothetical protein